MKIFRAAMAAVNIHTLWYTIIYVIVLIKYVPEWFQFRAVAEKGRESARAGGGERERGGEGEGTQRERVAVARTSEEGKEAGSSEA